MNDYLVGVRLRATAQADDYRVGDLELHVGDLVLVETANESAVGEVRRAKREIPEAKRERGYPRVLRPATEAEARAHRERREREERAIAACQRIARGRGLTMKVVDVEMHPAISRASSGRGSRCARSARATRRRSWTVSDRAAASSAVPRTSGASIRSR